MKTAFVICSRADSNRVPRKAFALLNGIPVIEHLIRRCIATGYPVILAIPHRDYEAYREVKNKFSPGDLYLYAGVAEDPMERMLKAATVHGVENIIRVCHDKIFIEKKAVDQMLSLNDKAQQNYVYSSNFVAGASCEIIKREALQKASEKFKNVEHISYAIRAVTKKCMNVDTSQAWKSEHRFLIDYPEDVKMMDILLHSLGNDCSLSDAIAFLDQHYWISKINRNPQVTIYTCALNAARWITKCMGSVAAQNRFRDCEYIIIDDGSTDGTSILAAKFCNTFKNTTLIRNQKNVGLASASNQALSMSRGKYIIRLDADDYFIGDHAVESLIREIERTKSDAVYPSNYHGSFKEVQPGDQEHHVGGAIFSSRALNHVKFTDGLRGFEGLDLYMRAKDQLKVSYLNEPVFFYRQHDESLSKTNQEEREKLKAQILGGSREGNESESTGADRVARSI